MTTQTPSIVQKLIWQVLMGECPGCGERIEFMAGRYTSRSDYKNFEDMEQKLIEWLRENQQKIKDVLAQQKKLNLEVQKMDWREYDNDVSDMVMKANSAVSKYSNQLCGIIPVLGLANCRDEEMGYGNHLIHILDRLSSLQLPHPEPPTPIKERPATKIPAKDATPERLKKSYREQADWYQWAVDYTGSEAEKARHELGNLRKLVELKELELADLDADNRSFRDILETYRELSADAVIDLNQQQEDCFN